MPLPEAFRAERYKKSSGFHCPGAGVVEQDNLRFGRRVHLDTVLDNGVIEVELVAMRRVAPRSAAQRTGGNFHSGHTAPSDRGRSSRSATTATFQEQFQDAPICVLLALSRLLLSAGQF